MSFRCATTVSSCNDCRACPLVAIDDLGYVFDIQVAGSTRLIQMCDLSLNRAENPDFFFHFMTTNPSFHSMSKEIHRNKEKENLRRRKQSKTHDIDESPAQESLK